MYYRSISKIDYCGGIQKDKGLVSILRKLFSFEFSFTLFLFAWAFKADPRFSWIPMDLTLLFFILSLCSGIIVFLAEKKRLYNRAVILVLSGIVFVLYILLSLTWTKGNVYAGQKALYFSTLTLWTLIACAFIIASDKHRLTRFINFLLILSIWIAIESTLKYMDGGNDVINALNSNYLALGYTLGMGFSISAAYAYLSGQSLSKRICMLVMSLYFIFLLLVLGGRGPLLSMAVSLFIPILFRSNPYKANKLKIKKYIIFISALFLALVLISVYLYFKDSLTATLYRMLLFLEPGMGTSGSTRLGYYIIAEKLWLINPVFGYGIGSWPILNGLPDANSYPHNLILEILVELGLTGLFLFGLTVFSALKGFKKSNNDRNIFLGSVILMMFMNAFMGAMLSGDINDNRIIFAILGLMAFEGNKNEKEGMCSDISTPGK